MKSLFERGCLKIGIQMQVQLDHRVAPVADPSLDGLPRHTAGPYVVLLDSPARTRSITFLRPLDNFVKSILRKISHLFAS